MTLIEHLRVGGKVTTRDKRAVTIYTTEQPGKYPIVGRIADYEDLAMWTVDGRIYADDFFDSRSLVPASKRFRHEGWVNVYPGDFGAMRETEDLARRHRECGCIACVRVVIEGNEGDGL